MVKIMGEVTSIVGRKLPLCLRKELEYCLASGSMCHAVGLLPHSVSFRGRPCLLKDYHRMYEDHYLLVGRVSHFRRRVSLERYRQYMKSWQWLLPQMNFELRQRPRKHQKSNHGSQGKILKQAPTIVYLHSSYSICPKRLGE